MNMKKMLSVLVIALVLTSARPSVAVEVGIKDPVIIKPMYDLPSEKNPLSDNQTP